MEVEKKDGSIVDMDIPSGMKRLSSTSTSTSTVMTTMTSNTTASTTPISRDSCHKSVDTPTLTTTSTEIMSSWGSEGSRDDIPVTPIPTLTTTLGNHPGDDQVGGDLDSLMMMIMDDDNDNADGDDHNDNKSAKASSSDPPRLPSEPSEQQQQELQEQQEEKAKNRMERIKAKAIKSANKELGGVDQDMLANAMGLTTTSSASSMMITMLTKKPSSFVSTTTASASSSSMLDATGFNINSQGGEDDDDHNSNNNNGKNHSNHNDPNVTTDVVVGTAAAAAAAAASSSLVMDSKELSQVTYLAETLGLPLSFFGVDPTPPSAGLSSCSSAAAAVTTTTPAADTTTTTTTTAAAAAAPADLAFSGGTEDEHVPASATTAATTATSASTTMMGPSEQARILVQGIRHQAVPLSNEEDGEDNQEEGYDDDDDDDESDSDSGSESGSESGSDDDDESDEDDEEGSEVNDRDDDEEEEDISPPPTIVAPQPQSLASALGMAIDPSDHAPPVRTKTTMGTFIPQPTTLEEKRAAKVEALSRLNRIKVKAIKSATKTLGVDVENLSAAVGVSLDGYDVHPTSSNHGRTQDRSNRKKASSNRQQEKDNDTMMTTDAAAAEAAAAADSEQIQYIADTLGIPVELFGVQAIPRPSKPKSKVLTRTNNDSKRRLSDKTKNKDLNLEETSPVGRPRPGSLAAALGMTIADGHDDDEDADNNDSPTRSMDATTKKNRDALLSAETDSSVETIQKSMMDVIMANRTKTTGPAGRLQPQPGSLAAALGISVDSSDTAPPIRKLSKRSSRAGGSDHEDDNDNDEASAAATSTTPSATAQFMAPQPGSLAAALGLKIDAAIPVASNRDKPQADASIVPGSLAAALGITNTNVTPTPAVPQANASIIPGSLAAALGITSTNVTPTPAIPQANASIMPGSLAAALGITSTNDTPTPAIPREIRIEKPQPGSLAAALGMSVGSAFTEPTLAKALNPKVNVDMAAPTPAPADMAQPGSLAAALGMRVTSSESSSKSRAMPTEQPQQGSLAAALGMRVTSSVSSSRSPAMPTEQPQQGSLAAALGMRVQAKSTSSSQNATKVPTPIVQPGSLAAALGMSVDPAATEPAAVCQLVCNTPTKVQPGSLAAALGMSVDRSPDASPIRQQQQQNNHDQGAGPSEPRRGSLAQALGMSIDSSVTAPPVRQLALQQQTQAQSPGQQPQARSLAAALGMKVTDNHPIIRGKMEQESVLPGSLAAALGMKAGINATLAAARAKLPSNTDMTSHSQPRAGSLAEALGMKVEVTDKPISSPAAANRSSRSSRSRHYEESESESSQESHVGFLGETIKVQPGSLAAALGIKGEPKALANQPTSQATSHNGKTLFGTVFSNVVAKQAPPKAAAPSAVPGTFQPQAGSLAAALGMAVTEPLPEVHASPRDVASFGDSIVTKTDGGVPPAASKTTPESDAQPSSALSVAPTSDTEVMLQVELAATRAELAGATAYGKALEQQMAQMAQAYADKLAELQQQIASYEEEVADKSRAIENLEYEVSEEQKAQETLWDRLNQTTGRLARTRAMLDETDAMLREEFAAIRELKDSFMQRYGGESTSTETENKGNNIFRSGQLATTHSLQKTLAREGDRRSSLKARLQKIREVHSKSPEK